MKTQTGYKYRKDLEAYFSDSKKQEMDNYIMKLYRINPDFIVSINQYGAGSVVSVCINQEVV